MELGAAPKRAKRPPSLYGAALASHIAEAQAKVDVFNAAHAKPVTLPPKPQIPAPRPGPNRAEIRSGTLGFDEKGQLVRIAGKRAPGHQKQQAETSAQRRAARENG
jgi:hypothetical protein